MKAKFHTFMQPPGDCQENSGSCLRVLVRLKAEKLCMVMIHLSACVLMENRAIPFQLGKLFHAVSTSREGTYSSMLPSLIVLSHFSQYLKFITAHFIQVGIICCQCYLTFKDLSIATICSAALWAVIPPYFTH